MAVTNSHPSEKEPIYIVLAHRMRMDISEGRLHPGSKIPSVRAFAATHSVSTTTALNCYKQLLDEGLIEVKDRSGYFVSGATENFLAAKVDINEFHSSKKSVYAPVRPENAPLYTCQLGPDLLPQALIKSVLSKIAPHLDDASLQYGHLQGSLTLRNALTDHFARNGLFLNADNMIVTNGCIDAVSLALEAVVGREGRIAVGRPCFPGIIELIKVKGYEALFFDSSCDAVSGVRNMMCEEAADAILISSNHCNPTGESLSNEAKQEIAGLSARYDVPIIEDDVYRELAYDGIQPLPIKYWDETGTVIWCSSVSKTLSAGLRLGWLAGGKYVDDILAIKSATTFGSVGIVQDLMRRLLISGAYQAHLRQLTRELSSAAKMLKGLLVRKLPHEAVISNSTGGLALWITVPRLDARLFEQKCAQEHIYIKGGYSFGGAPAHLNSFRLNVGAGVTSQVRSEIDHICSLIPSCTHPL